MFGCDNVNSDKIKNLILYIIMTCILGVVYYNFYLSNQINQIMTNKKSIDTISSNISTLINQKKSIDNKTLLVKNQSRDIDIIIPNQYDKKEITKYFYYLIKETGVGSDVINFSEPSTKTEDYRTVSINLKIDGSLSNIKEFIERIENSERKYTISQCNVNPLDDDFWVCSMTIEVYSYN